MINCDKTTQRHCCRSHLIRYTRNDEVVKIKILFLFLLLITPFVIFGQSKKDKIYRYSESLLEHYNTRVVIFSLVFSKDYPLLFPDTLVGLEFEINEHVDKIGKDYIFYHVDSCLSSLPRDIRGEKLNKMYHWCDCYYILKSHFQYYCFDIIFEIEGGVKKILVDYLSLERNEGRDLSSLASAENEGLFFDIVTYISTLIPEKQLSFYQAYFEKLKEYHKIKKIIIYR